MTEAFEKFVYFFQIAFYFLNIFFDQKIVIKNCGQAHGFENLVIYIILKCICILFTQILCKT